MQQKVESIFATRLKELRGDESQASFAQAIGLNRVQYAKYESGVNVPSVSILLDICRVHACSADWLLGLDDMRRAPPPSPDRSPDKVKDLKKAIITLLKEY